MGAITPVGEELPGVPASSRLNAPYPNPFNPSTNVSFNLAVMPAGRHEVLWDGVMAGSPIA